MSIWNAGLGIGQVGRIGTTSVLNGWRIVSLHQGRVSAGMTRYVIDLECGSGELAHPYRQFPVSVPAGDDRECLPDLIGCGGNNQKSSASSPRSNGVLRQWQPRISASRPFCE